MKKSINKISIFVTGILLLGLCIGCGNPSAPGKGGTVPPTPEYSITVTVNDSLMGFVTPSQSSAEVGTTVTLTVTPQPNYEYIDGTLEVNNGEVPLTREGPFSWTFVMPASDIAVSCEFMPGTGPLLPTHTISISVNNAVMGSVTSTHSVAAAGTTVTLTVLPEINYQYKEGTLKVNNGAVPVTKAGDGSWTFIMPDGDALVSCEFMAGSGPIIQTYAVNIYINDIAMGTVTSTHNYAEPGTVVTLTVTPKTNFGYKDGTLKVNNGAVALTKGSGLSWTFVMPAAVANVSCEFIVLPTADRSVYFNGKFGKEIGPAGLVLWPDPDCIQLWSGGSGSVTGNFKENVTGIGYMGNTEAVLLQLNVYNAWGVMASFWDEGVGSDHYDLKFNVRAVGSGKVDVGGQAGTCSSLVNGVAAINTEIETFFTITAGGAWEEKTVTLPAGFDVKYLGLVAKNPDYEGVKVYFDNVRLVYKTTPTIPVYPVNISVNDNEWGDVTANHATAQAGTTIILTVTPKANCEYTDGTLKVNNGAVTLTKESALSWSFSMPSGPANISCDFNVLPNVKRPVYFNGKFGRENGATGLALWPVDACIQLWQTAGLNTVTGDFKYNMSSVGGYMGNTEAIMLELGRASADWGTVASFWESGVQSDNYVLKFNAKAVGGNAIVAGQAGIVTDYSGGTFYISPKTTDVNVSLTAGEDWKEITVNLPAGFATTYIGLVAKNATVAGTKVFFDNVRLEPK